MEPKPKNWLKALARGGKRVAGEQHLIVCLCGLVLLWLGLAEVRPWLARVIIGALLVAAAVWGATHDSGKPSR